MCQHVCDLGLRAKEAADEAELYKYKEQVHGSAEGAEEKAHQVNAPLHSVVWFSTCGRLLWTQCSQTSVGITVISWA